jgi:hypothetical protein
MSDIGVEEEIIIIDIESDIADDNNINVAFSVGAGGDPLDGNGNDDAAVGGHNRGQQGNDLWSFYINNVNPHQHKLAVYKHCRMLMNHHKKNESVKVHLNKCAPFHKLMNGMEEDKCHTPTLAKCGGESLHLEKLGFGRTFECSELDNKGQNTSHWGVLGVIGKLLKLKYRKWPCLVIWTSAVQVMGKRRVRSQTGSLTPDH